MNKQETEKVEKKKYWRRFEGGKIRINKNEKIWWKKKQKNKSIKQKKQKKKKKKITICFLQIIGEHL